MNGFTRRVLVALAAAAAVSAAAASALFVHVERGELSAARNAEASVAVLLSLDELVGGAQHVVIGTPVEHSSRWEDLPAGRRIVTYTKVTIDETIAGSSAPEITVRTLGGVVDDIGQQVSGEAMLKLNERALLFLSDVEDGPKNPVTLVTGMAQGHFPLDESGSEPVLKPSPDRGTLVKRRGPSVPAALVLVGASVSDARDKITESVKRQQAGK